MMTACRWRWMKSWKPFLDSTGTMKRINTMKITDVEKCLNDVEFMEVDDRK